MAMAISLVHAQNALKRVYNETIDPMTQIDDALVKAKAANKYVVCQVGGNWCPWCLRFADFVEKDSVVNKTVNDNFEFIHVNYNPRKSSTTTTDNSAALMHRLGNPARFGSPFLWCSTPMARYFTFRTPVFWRKEKGIAKNGC